MSKLDECPKCGRHTCFGYNDGKCMILTGNNFGKRNCPFYKTAAQIVAEEARVKNR